MSDGSYDLDFDGDGILLADLGGGDYGSAMTIDDRDHIFLAGTSSVSGSGDTFIAKFDANGNLVTEFGSSGVTKPRPWQPV